MAATLKEVEAIPASYPAVTGLSTAAAALDADALWQRVEAYCRVRFTEREVIWTVEGPGLWEAPLSPATISTVGVWEGGAWQAVTLSEGPYGYDLPGDGPYRITANVGAGSVPAAVSEAFRRLAEYLADKPDRAGASSYSIDFGELKESYDRTPAWVAKALQLSGAADLLRPYKRNL